MATTKITNPELFDLGSLNTALQLPSGTTAERPTSPSTGEWRYNTTTNLIEFYDGADWRDLQSEDIPPIPSENFAIVNWTGNGTSQSITGVGFKPDWVWIKEKTNSSSNELYDSSRGATNFIMSNSTNGQAVNAQGLQSFDSDGFTVGNDGAVNAADDMYIAWCWKANGGTTSSNTDGSITSTVQVNTKAGFSIVTYTGDGADGTVGHGLGVTPEIVLVKRLNSTGNWSFNGSFGGLTYGTNKLVLNSADALTSDTNEVLAATSTTFTAGQSGSVGASGGTYVAYCFAPKAGYSSFGSYTGNGNYQGPIVNTGFEPYYIVIKRTDASSNWQTFDATRDPQNPATKVLFPNDTTDTQNLLGGDYGILNRFSNGFQITNSSYAGSTNFNVNGGTYIYWAFAKDASTYTPTTTGAYKGISYTGNDYGNAVYDTINTSGLSWIKSMSFTEANSVFD